MHYSDDTELGDRLKFWDLKLALEMLSHMKLVRTRYLIFLKDGTYGKSDKDFHNLKKEIEQLA